MRRERVNQREAPPRVFVSATSKDLGTVRELVKQALLTMGCMPVEQSNFPPDYRSVHEMIKHRIAGCEAVIHIVGCCYGSEPEPATLPPGAPRRSYTQIEADIARELGKKLYVFVCPEDFPYDHAPLEGEEEQRLQRTYRQELSKGDTLWTEVSGRDQIAIKVRELQFELERLKKTLDRGWRRQALLAAGLILILAVLAWGVFYAAREATGTHRQINKLEQSKRADLEAVGAELISLQKQLAQAGQKLSDLKPELIYEQLSKRLGLSKEELASLIAIGKHSKDLSQQAAAALAALDFEQAESLYIQAATSQEQNFLKAARDLLGGGRAAFLNFRFAEAVGHLEKADAALTAAGGRGKDSGLWFEIRDMWITSLLQDGIRAEPERGVAALRRSLEMSKETLTRVSRSSAPQDWAKTQNNLGNVLKELGIRAGGEEGKKDLQDAVGAYRSALEVRTREQLPQDWAQTQHNLGSVLDELGIRADGEEGKKDLQDTVAAYRSALEVFTRKQLPQYWAKTQNNLGNVLAELGTRAAGDEGKKDLQDAVAAYRSALEVFTREQLPQDWAKTQNNLGNVLAELGTRAAGDEGKKDLQDAVAAYRSALEVRTREQLPQKWAMTQNNLGLVLDDLGTRIAGDEGKKYLEQAVTILRNDLEVRTRAQFPQYWAETQNNLGIALKDLGTRIAGDEGKKYLEQAVTILRSALEMRTRDQLPQEWAHTQDNLGTGLSEIAARTNGQERERYFQQALAAYNNALTIFTPESDPYDNELVRRKVEKTHLALREESR
jgi:tetratricopeptide (TPR) repeat protein